MLQTKISLVFPCWHAAQHMKHVLEDLQAQTFTDFEAILVNDGDDTQIPAMQEIAEKDSRITILNKQNGGVASARNAGTDIAKGIWIIFPDPDDRFSSNYLQSLYDAVKDTNADMAGGGYTKYHEINGMVESRTFNLHPHQHKLFSIAEGYDEIYKWGNHALWNKLFKVSVIRQNNLRHDETAVNKQDIIFCLQYYMLIKTIGLTSDCGYIYYIYEKGNAKAYNENFEQTFQKIIDLGEKLQKKLGWPEQRIKSTVNTLKAHLGYQLCTNCFTYNSPLSLNNATERIRKELLERQDIKAAVLAEDMGKDYLMKFHQLLIRTNNAKLIAYTYKILSIIKKHNGNLYVNLKPLFRGQY